MHTDEVCASVMDTTRPAMKQMRSLLLWLSETFIAIHRQQSGEEVQPIVWSDSLHKLKESH